MQFSDTTKKNGILQTAEMLCKLGDAGITGDTTLLKQFTSLVNNAYNEVWMAIMSVDRNWKADDFNYLDYPEASINLVNAQRDYALPAATSTGDIATLLRVNRVWVLDAAGLLRHELTLMSPDKDFDYINTGFPWEYRLHGKSIYLNARPATAAVTLTNGLIIQFQRITDAFVSTDPTQQPGFIATYHDLLPLKASAWYLLPIDPQLATIYEERFRTRLELLKHDYANNVDDEGNSITSEIIRFR